MKTLDTLKVGQSAIVETVGGQGALRQHFLDMGLIPGVEVTLVQFAPMGDPMELRIRDYELTLRLEDAHQIEITQIHPTKTQKQKKPKIKREHPGLGEGGRFHQKGDGNPLPEGSMISCALVGNQNSGKTTLFNQLTGSNQHVGNFPGVTVDRKDGIVKGHPNMKVTDLPGIYSMSPYSKEEIVSRNFVLQEKPNVIINIVDATNIERNLYLTMQLLEMEIPMVIALNFMDEVTNNNGVIDVNGMEELLGVPVIPISAAKNAGVHELIEHAYHVAYFQEKPLEQDFCNQNDFNGSVHRCIHAIIHLIQNHAQKVNLPIRFAADKVIEGDSLILDQLELDSVEMESIETIIHQLEQQRKLDRSAAIADMRFCFIQKVVEQTVFRPSKETKERIRSRKIDKILTGKYTAIPLFVGIMFSIFVLTFNVIGPFFQDLLESTMDSITQMVDTWLTGHGINEVIHSLIIDGIFTGVGSVISFLPIIVILFFFLSLLEDSGYFSRIAFFMDHLLRKIGLSGRSIVPLLIGFGCTVPAVMATRTLPSERDRRLTILLTPFMSCTAKLPIYAFFVAAFFSNYGGFVITGMYILGIVVGIIMAMIYKKTLYAGETVPFVMELPNYRLPSARSVFQLLWEKAKDFLQRAFSIILIATVVVWFLQYFDFHLNAVEDPQMSILAAISGWISPILSPLGLGDWRISTSLITGFMAKESVVSTLKVLFGGNVQTALTTSSALALLVFSLLYTPCVAAIASVRRELGNRWAIFVVFWQFAIAWIIAFIVRMLFMAIGG